MGVVYKQAITFDNRNLNWRFAHGYTPGNLSTLSNGTQLAMRTPHIDHQLAGRLHAEPPDQLAQADNLNDNLKIND